MADLPGTAFGPNTDRTVVEAARDIAIDQNVADVVQGVRALDDRRDHTNSSPPGRGCLSLSAAIKTARLHRRP